MVLYIYMQVEIKKIKIKIIFSHGFKIHLVITKRPIRLQQNSVFSLQKQVNLH